jgi:hypothetical protein
MTEIKYDFYHELAEIVDDFKKEMDKVQISEMQENKITAEDIFWKVVRMHVDEQNCLEVTAKKLIKIE